MMPCSWSCVKSEKWQRLPGWHTSLVLGSSLAHAQELAVGLHQREVGARQDCLRLGQGIDLTSAGVLADIVILEEPVAVLVETFNVIDSRQSLLHLGLPLLGLLHDVHLSLSLGAVLLGDGLGIRNTLLCCIPGELLVVTLCILLVELCLLHLLLQVSNKAVHHGNDTV